MCTHLIVAAQLKKDPTNCEIKNENIEKSSSTKYMYKYNILLIFSSMHSRL